MTNIKAFGQFSPFSVGFDEMFNTLQRASTPASNYPPYNIIKKGVAGHKQSDIEIEIEDNTLRVSATYGDRDDDIEFVHKGISERGFYKSFALAEYVEVKKAKMSDGILVIELEKNIPEEQKPKKIKISR